jgi:hypothetical protein
MKSKFECNIAPNFGKNCHNLTKSLLVLDGQTKTDDNEKHEDDEKKSDQ